MNKFARYFQGGLSLLREHQQIWFTIFVGLIILGSFVFVAYRFTTIARDAQTQLFNDRGGWLIDGVVSFSTTVVDEPNVLRAALASIMAKNTTMEELFVVAPHGNGTYRLFVAADGEREGTVPSYGENLTRLFGNAYADPSTPYSMVLGSGGDRRFYTARAITNDVGRSIAIAVTGLRLSEADRQIAAHIRSSILALALVSIVITVLFVRHARIIDYATLYRKQREVDEMKDSFISMASHELKSPLTVIRGYIEVLQEGVHSKKETAEYFHRIDQSATELRDLVDDILDVQRIEMGRLRFTPETFVLADVVQEVHDTYKHEAEDKSLAFECAIAPEAADVQVKVDRGRLKQVVVNLVSNALKYTLAGSITMSLDTSDGALELSVRDTGVGMTADQQEKLFGKFYRAEAQETRGVSGTGLGLWITKHIVEEMGGGISVESIKGEGSRFVVSFPVVQGKDAARKNG